ncbi:MAG: 3-methyl-2-oxobutanoate hydroxymethyltransferase [Candidatus Heimdallarchaeaceae archaeon]
MIRKITIKDFQKLKEEREKITMISAYTFPIAKILDEMFVDSILVGDSLGMNVLGFENTLKVTLEDMIRHTAAVSRAVKRALVIGDLPFLSYGLDKEETVKQAGNLIKNGNCEAVKLEGGEERKEEVEALLSIGVPVLGHIGLTPTYVNKFGGFKVQGRNEKAQNQLLKDAKALEEAGTFGIVIESVPWKLAKRITEELAIPTIGIGAGEFCDGQVLVIDDLIGLSFIKKPKFVKKYADVKTIIQKAVQQYVKEVKEESFPSEEYRYD